MQSFDRISERSKLQIQFDLVVYYQKSENLFFLLSEETQENKNCNKVIQ